MNIVVIISDTFRRDRLSFYREPAVVDRNQRTSAMDIPWPDRIADTPNLNKLAQRATIFDRYYAAGFPTMPTRADLLTGRWTFSYLQWEPLPATEVTLPQVLSQAGYVTAGVVDTPFYTKNGYGYDRGFRYFYDLKSQGPPNWDLFLPRPRRIDDDYAAPNTFRTAERVLEQLCLQHDGTPFLLWVDTWDPHEPWEPPLWYGRRYDPDYRPPSSYKVPPYANYEQGGFSDVDLEEARTGYLGEISMVDHYVGRLLGHIDALGLAEDTAVVFVTDHGYYFGEHGGLLGKMIRPTDQSIEETRKTKAGTPWLRSPLYEEVSHIPLLMALPGAQGRRVGQLASAIDVMPTLLDICGVSPPAEVDIHGRSLARLVHGEDVPGREFVVTTTPLANPPEEIRVVDSMIRGLVEYQPATITTERWTLLYSAAGETTELYDLEHDPRQLDNAAARYPDVVKDLHGRYASLLQELDVPSRYLEPRQTL